MRAKLALILVLFAMIFAVVSCGDVGDNKQEAQRKEAVDVRAKLFEKAEARYPVPNNVNFPARELLVEYTKRQDLKNHPWFVYIMTDFGQITHYFVAKQMPVSSCAFLSSTEVVRENSYGSLLLTAPSTDGIYYGGSGAAAACNGWVFIDAATDVMGVIYGMNIMVYDAPLILETEPALLQLKSD